MKKSVFLLTILILISLDGLLYGQLELAGIFSDHMVIQRDLPINVWGNAYPETQVTLTLNKKSYSIQVEPSGTWEIQLPAMEAGGPYEMEIHNGENVLSLTDIFIGDVWICSGQSNMEWTVALSEGAEEAVIEANDPLIRHFKVAHSYAEEPDYELVEGAWEVAGPETVADYTAVGYYFARELREHVDVPIGLINTSWGGSRIEAWMSAEALGMSDPQIVLNEYRQREKLQQQNMLEELESRFPGLSEVDLGMQGQNPLWSSPILDEANWSAIRIPGQWEDQGYDGFDGIGWYRIHFDVRDDINESEVMVSLGKIDDSDQVWLNGQFIGGIEQAWNQTREYKISSSILKKGVNVIAVRVEDTGGGGGIHGDERELFLMIGEEQIPLAGKAIFRPGAIMKPSPLNNVHQTPTLLYNKMIHPLLNFPIKGVIWYQGESNAGNIEDARAYADEFKDMITDWRSKWSVGNFPFLYVQLANFMTPPSEPGQSNWAELRASQSEALELENVGEAVIIDIGEADDIHPGNKKDVGYRLSLEARRIAYGEDIISYSPRPEVYTISGKMVTITFDQDLVVHDKYGYVKGLDIESVDGQRFWALGQVLKNQLKVYHPRVMEVKKIRYGWADNPDDVNLYNIMGLPVSPFRINVLK